MNKLIILVILVLALFSVASRCEVENAEAVCKMRDQDCKRMHQAFQAAVATNEWNKMPKDAQQLFQEIYANNC